MENEEPNNPELNEILFSDLENNYILKPDLDPCCFDENNGLIFANDVGVDMMATNSETEVDKHSSDGSNLYLFPDNDGEIAGSYTFMLLADDEVQEKNQELSALLNKNRLEIQPNMDISIENNQMISVADLDNRLLIQDNTVPSTFSKPNADTVSDSAEQNKYLKYKCKVCSESFAGLTEYRKHIKLHNVKQYGCKYCKETFNHSNNLLIHEALHDTTVLTCPLTNCRARFGRFASLKAHVKIHEEEETLFCSECDENFTNKLYLDIHDCAAQETSKKKILTCKDCNCNFDNYKKYVEHRKTHLSVIVFAKKRVKKKPYKYKSNNCSICSVCKKVFRKPSQLQRHVRIHTGERPFVCKTCNKSFNQANSLKLHMMKHTGEKPFKCDSCSSTFSQRGNLTKHVKRVHFIENTQERGYQCSECPCFFKKIYSLNAHKNRKHVHKAASAEDQKSQNTEITIEHGADELEDDDITRLLKEKKDIDTINIGLENRKAGDVIYRKVYVTTVGNRRSYQCSHCMKQSTILKEIIRHLKYMVLGKPFKCQRCASTFAQKSAFITHLALHEKEYPCDICDQKFPNLKVVKNHKKVHLITERTFGDIPAEKYACNNCNQSIENQDAIFNHACSKNIVKPYIVQRKQDQNSLSSEMNVLLNENMNFIFPPYKCSKCQKSFVSHGVLKLHEYNVHEPISCMQCFLLLENRMKFTEHMEIHKTDGDTQMTSSSNPILFKCTVCSDAYNDYSTLEKHFFTVHNQQIIEDKSDTNNLSSSQHEEIFEETFFSLDTDSGPDTNNAPEEYINVLAKQMNVNLDKHIIEEPLFLPDANSSILYRCLTCFAQFVVEAELQTHIQESEGCNSSGLENLCRSDYFYLCGTCSLTFQTIEDFTNHLRVHYDTKPYFCFYCVLRCSSDLALTEHVMEHFRNGIYPCMHCGKTYDTMSDMKTHITDVHLVSVMCRNKEENKKKSSDLLVLDESAKSLLTTSLLNKFSPVSEIALRNMMMMDGEKKKTANEFEKKQKNKKKMGVRVCSYCDKPFKKLSDLDRHMRIHTGERPFTCGICDKAFGFKSILYKHMKTHFTATSVICHLCTRVFSSVSALRLHLRIHTGEKPFECLQCNKKFRTAGHKAAHDKKHLSENCENNIGNIIIEIDSSCMENANCDISGVDRPPSSEFLLSHISNISDLYLLNDCAAVDFYSDTNTEPTSKDEVSSQNTVLDLNVLTEDADKTNESSFFLVDKQLDSMINDLFSNES